MIVSSFIKKAPLALGMVLLISQSAFAAGDDKGAKPELLTGASTSMLSNTCAGCHGIDGASKGPGIPSIGGMAKSYLVESMEGFKSGDIPSTIMARIAKGYTTEEFEQMGDFFAEKPYVQAKQESNAKLAAKGKKLHKKYCKKCHSEAGTLADDESGFLSGQWKPYLAATLTDFVSGDRKAPKKMKKKLKKMIKKKGKDSVAALIEYYASNGGK